MPDSFCSKDKDGVPIVYTIILMDRRWLSRATIQTMHLLTWSGKYGMLLKLQVELGKINTSLCYIQELPLSGQLLFVGQNEYSSPFYQPNSGTGGSLSGFPRAGRTTGKAPQTLMSVTIVILTCPHSRSQRVFVFRENLPVGRYIFRITGCQVIFNRRLAGGVTHIFQ